LAELAVMLRNPEGGFWAREFWQGRGGWGWQSLPVSCGCKGACREGDGEGAKGWGAYCAMITSGITWKGEATNNVVASSKKGFIEATNQGAMEGTEKLLNRVC